MRVLVTGANGQLGRELVRQLEAHQYTVFATDVDTVDITDLASVNRTVADIQPEIVLHCAALTAVDYCAQHPEEALTVNGIGTQYLAAACQRQDVTLLYVSTNEVFDGRACCAYREYDRPNPRNPYGYSKWVGEQVVRDLVRKHYIVRPSWLFAHGGKNFIHTVLNLARQHGFLRVVTNEIGCPTYSVDLADAICRIMLSGCYGIYHLTNSGHTTRYQFARTVLDLVGFADVPIHPITLSEYQRASQPPEYGVLENFAAARLGIRLRPWQEALIAFIERENLLES